MRKRGPSMKPAAVKQRAYRARLNAKQATQAVALAEPNEDDFLLDKALQLIEQQKEDLSRLRAVNEGMEAASAASTAIISSYEAELARLRAAEVRYQELDAAVAPYRETIKKFGFSEAQAVDQLFKWQMALCGPQKVQAFVALMKSHGVDPATFATEITGQVAPMNGNGNGNGLEHMLETLMARQENLERAVRVNRARHAGSSMRTASPDLIAGASADLRRKEYTPSRNDSVRDSIRKALAETQDVR